MRSGAASLIVGPILISARLAARRQYDAGSSSPVHAMRVLKRDDESSSRFSSLLEHDLFGKPLHTFPDHALVLIVVAARLVVLLLLLLLIIVARGRRHVAALLLVILLLWLLLIDLC